MAVIRVSGPPGSGKTTVAEKLAKALNYENYYTGDVFRKIAKERGLSVEEFYKKIVAEPELEKEIDKRQTELMMTKDNLIVQGRMAPLLPYNPKFKKINILLTVSMVEGTCRQLLRPENKNKTFKEMIQLSSKRMMEEKSRLFSLYGIIDYLDPAPFDIILDTTGLNPDQVFDKLLTEIREKLREV